MELHARNRLVCGYSLKWDKGQSRKDFTFTFDVASSDDYRIKSLGHSSKKFLYIREQIWNSIARSNAKQKIWQGSSKRRQFFKF